MIDKGVGQTHQTFCLISPAEKIAVVRPELNCFAVQMVSHPQFFLRFLSILPDAFVRLLEIRKPIDDFEKFCGV